MNKLIFDDFIALPCTAAIQVLYEDNVILAINKPSGLLSLSGKNPQNQDSVHFRLAQQYPNITLAHRLDFGTSGLMVLAKNKEVNANLTHQFQSKTVVKHYESMLAGHLTQEEGVIDLAIAKDASIFPRLKICQQLGKVAKTHFKVLQRLPKPRCTRVIFTPLTGRTHQLRIHSQAIGHPILGCDLYGDTTTQSLAARLMLHSVSLGFTHPQTQSRINLSCPCPF
ncbi:MAG: RluA family pseudouridine synthase [Paraglaciecola sp.]|nr:RluA family pseudouridine synthase [Paraglaciecola sp.]NCT47864.1 RluA family pseudouridine synthase [Paraglaciecola sp.]